MGLYEPTLCALCIFYGSSLGGFCGNPYSGSTLFACFGDSFPLVELPLLLWLFCFYRVTLPSLNMKDIVLTHSVLFSPVWLLSLGGLHFSKDKTEGKWVWGWIQNEHMQITLYGLNRLYLGLYVHIQLHYIIIQL